MFRPTLLLTFLLLTFLTLVLSVSAQSPESMDEAAIRKGMADQAAAWNRGSLDDFMKTYWDSDSLMFIGQSGITYGYAPTLAHYKASYDDADKMGKLFFSLLEVKRLSGTHYFVIGKWFLKRKAGDVGGIFSLLFRKMDGRWLIVADHTS
jgi:ketosteroid isomerase-like protein